MSMQSGKSPGPDGFSTELKKKISSKLSVLLKNVFDIIYIVMLTKEKEKEKIAKCLS